MDETVRLMHYDPRWRQEFEQTRSGVLQSCRGWVVDVRHIGSTAVGGMIARPILDVVAAVQDEGDVEQALAESADLIEGLNYLRGETPMWAAETIVLNKPRRGEPTHRVFLTYLDSPFWRSSLAVRDALQSDRSLSLRFEETKVARWRDAGGDPQQYADDKSVFFAHLIEHHL
ncbi:GrpB family protein [Roseiconus nitratireducens]|uniref:GrpB family protein n=1 Tax=Roseiconus nitratireducens TaxID=2605748 RepID=A0A5M6D4G9_9BACT|nr:GrpB family protein [Roseiconus nitratireducens]KAA5542233.1 GrpB family protein [Roseiconus nitratireducens]